MDTMNIEAPSNWWNIEPSMGMRSNIHWILHDRDKPRSIAFRKVSDTDLCIRVCVCVYICLHFVCNVLILIHVMLFTWSGTCVCIHNPIHIHMIWRNVLWFRNLVFHPICIRIHNKIIQFSLRSDSIGLVVILMVVIVLADLLSWANIHSSNNNPYWYILISVFASTTRKKNLEREEKKNERVYPGCCHQQHPL